MKSSIRQLMRAYTLPSHVSSKICENLKSIPYYKHKTAAFYPLFRNEPNLLPVFNGDSFLLPVWSNITYEMSFHFWQEGDHLCNGMPLLSAPQGVPDIFLIPALAFSKDGYRLGRGKGFYDRTLLHYPKSLFIGVASEEQIVRDSSFAEPHDVRMDIIITEEGIRYKNSKLISQKEFGPPIMKLWDLM